MKKMTYEEAVTKLEDIVSNLESGELSLEESIKCFEEGTKLAAFCSDILKKAEFRVQQFANSEDEQ